MLSFCNHYPAHIWVMITFYNSNCEPDGKFESMGWWSIAPGNCVNVYNNDLADLNPYWYYYAEAEDGAVWAGPYKVAVYDQAFDYCYRAVTQHESMRFVGMRELDIGDYADYTVNLVS
jgi:uncharacterized membrane protein